MTKQTQTGLKFLISLLIVSILITSLVGCSSGDKEFSALGMTITLTEDFRRDDMEPFDALRR